MNFKWLWIVFALLNAFIISVSGTVCTSLKIGYVWQVLTEFGLLFIMILCKLFLKKLPTLANIFLIPFQIF